MSCSANAPVLAAPRNTVSVNGVAVSRAAIARELQHHPAKSPAAAWTEAARALVIRELLLQEAQRLDLAATPQDLGESKRETDEEALIRAVIEQEVKTPEPDEGACRRYHAQNNRRFRSPDIYEAAHILFAARRDDAEGYVAAQRAARDVLDEVLRDPGRFGELAESHSACPSGTQGGNLGQITTGQTTPEFEEALLQLAPGQVSPEPVATRYGFHIIRLERHHPGQSLPFEVVAERIRDYLATAVEQRALAQYISILAGRATITGVELQPSDGPLVQ